MEHHEDHDERRHINTSLLLDMDLDLSQELQNGTSFVWQDDTWATVAYAIPEGNLPPTTALVPDSFTGTISPATCEAPSQGSSCTTVATGLFTSIIESSPSCLMKSHGNSTSATTQASVDSVLSTTQTALRAIRGLRHCSCLTAPHLQLLLTVVCAEVITSYRRIIRVYTLSDPDVACPVSGSVAESGQRAKETFVLRRAPLLLGDHPIEGNTERVLIGQILKSRLQELAGFMGEMLHSPGLTTGPGAGNDTKSSFSSLLSAVYGKRDSFLHDQLSAAVREVAQLQLGDTHNGGGDTTSSMCEQA